MFFSCKFECRKSHLVLHRNSYSSGSDLTRMSRKLGRTVAHNLYSTYFWTQKKKTIIHIKRSRINMLYFWESFSSDLTKATSTRQHGRKSYLQNRLSLRISGTRCARPPRRKTNSAHFISARLHLDNVKRGAISHRNNMIWGRITG